MDICATVCVPVKPLVGWYLGRFGGGAIELQEWMPEGVFFNQLLGLKRKRQDCHYRADIYTGRVNVVLGRDFLWRRAHYLSKTSISKFNSFIVCLAKREMRQAVSFAIEFGGMGKDEAILFYMKSFGVEEGVWRYDAIRRDFFRWQQNGDKVWDFVTYKREAA